MTDRPNPVTTTAQLGNLLPTNRMLEMRTAGVVILTISDQEAAYLVAIMEREAEHWHDRHGAHQGTPVDLEAATKCENLSTYIESRRPIPRRFIAAVHMSQRHNGETA